MGLEIGRLGKAFAAIVKGADIRSVSCMDADVGTQIEVEGEPLATPLKCALVSKNHRTNVKQIKTS